MESGDESVSAPTKQTPIHSSTPEPNSTPYDPKTAHHLGECEYINTTDAAVVKVLLKITDKGSYDRVECGACGAGWQVPHYAESVG